MDAEHFRKCVPKFGPLTQEDKMRAEAIFLKYIKKKSPFRIHLEHKVLKNISSCLKEVRKKNLEVPRNIFDEAFAEVMRVMQHEQFPRFAKSMFYLAMYNSMTTRTPYELPDDVWKEFLVAAQGGEEDGWEYVAETKGVLIHKKLFSGSTYTCSRGSGVVPIPPEEMYIFATNIFLREHWDLMFRTARVVETLGPNTVICHYSYSPPKGFGAFFDKQDFVVLRTEKRQSDGTILVLSRSVVHQDAPVVKGFNRAEVESSGFVIRSCGATSSVVIYVSQVEMSVPKWIEGKVVEKRALLPEKIRKFVVQEIKDSKKEKRQPIWLSMKDSNTGFNPSQTQ